MACVREAFKGPKSALALVKLCVKPILVESMKWILVLNRLISKQTVRFDLRVAKNQEIPKSISKPNECFFQIFGLSVLVVKTVKSVV